jgi:hypothetical protein
MKNFLLVALLLVTVSFNNQKQASFDVGEWFKFRIHYGVVTAGYATVEVKEALKNNKKVFHAVGKGYTTGMTKFFFKVEDNLLLILRQSSEITKNHQHQILLRLANEIC